MYYSIVSTDNKGYNYSQNVQAKKQIREVIDIGSNELIIFKKGVFVHTDRYTDVVSTVTQVK